MVSDQAVEPGSTVVIRVGEREESWTVVAPHERTTCVAASLI